MSEALISERCQWCNGTGTENSIVVVNGQQQIVPVPCTHCGADGKLTSSRALDTTDIMEDLTICKRRLKKIMDKLEIGD